jgi:hypothetical protein
VGLYISNEKSYEASGLDVDLRYFVHAIYGFQQIPWRMLRNCEASSSSGVVRSIQRKNLYRNIVGIVNGDGNKHPVNRGSHYEIVFTIGKSLSLSMTIRRASAHELHPIHTNLYAAG